MVQRGRHAPFMAGAWVFPGGVVDDIDRSEAAQAALDVVDDSQAHWLAAAVREVVEETGIWLSAAPTVLPPDRRPAGAAIFTAARRHGRFAVGNVALLSNWVTPTMVPLRFDARFYVTMVDHRLEGIPDRAEIDAVAWVSPRDAIERASGGSFLLPFPTRRTLADFARYESAGAIFAAARSQTGIVPVQPRLRILGDVIEALVPGDAGYEELGDLPPDPDIMARVVSVTGSRGEPVPELSPGRAP